MLVGNARILEVLVSHGINFTVVGGVAAVLRGAPITTRDIDIVYELEDANVEKMLLALSAMGARFRHRPDLEPLRSHIAARGHKLLQTDFGELDVLGFAGDNHEYPELAAWSSPMQIGPLRVMVLNLDAQIQLKKETGRPKDLVMLPILRALHAELSARDAAQSSADSDVD